MTRREPTPDGAVLVAIDIAKTRNGVLIEPSRDSRRRRLKVLDARADHDRLIEVLRGYGVPVVAEFEAIGRHEPDVQIAIDAVMHLAEKPTERL